MVGFSLRRLFGIQEQPGRRHRPRSQPRLCLEMLEDRLVPSTLHVGSGSGEFATIQAAVTAAHSNDTILVDPGTYTEQVKIDDTGHLRDNLKLVASGQNSTFIKAPAVMTSPNAIVEVSGAQNVTIRSFTIEGPASGDNHGGSLFGIAVDGGGLATITNNHITAIEDTPFNGVQEGFAIDVGRASDNTTGTATISHNTIDNYQKGGIEVSNMGSSAEIEHNKIVGVGPTAVIAQNGIEISSGASAEISQNDVSGNVYSLQTVVATGILLFNPGATTVDDNTLTNNDVGIYSFGATGPEIEHNKVAGNTFDGIILDTTTEAEVTHNTAVNNGFGDHTGNPTGDGGIALFNSTNNTVANNQSKHNSGDGIFADSASTGNVFEHNRLKGNTLFDAEDQSIGSGTAGTANTWNNNHGKTSSPEGLVKRVNGVKDWEAKVG